MKIWHRLTQGVGAASSFLTLWGIYWLAGGLRREFDHPTVIPQAPFYRQVFFTMSAVDAVFLVVMILCCIGLLARRPMALRAYTWFYVALAVYAVAPGFFWGSGPLGRSIAAASGIGDLGLAPLVFVPLPLVYPIMSVLLVNVAMRRMRALTDGMDLGARATAASR